VKEDAENNKFEENKLVKVESGSAKILKKKKRLNLK
jgi:hypothetical protein